MCNFGKARQKSHKSNIGHISATHTKSGDPTLALLESLVSTKKNTGVASALSSSATAKKRN
jgi:ornithine cyclodeaminase/alanine dehydrogenase-like protein (mu-crystallin family)